MSRVVKKPRFNCMWLSVKVTDAYLLLVAVGTKRGLLMNYIIREMVKADTKQVQDVAKKSWNSTYEGIIPNKIQENFLKGAYNDAMMERRLSNSLMLVAEAENKIVGFANFTPVNDEGQSELSG